jgi:hypothetical protein
VKHNVRWSSTYGNHDSQFNLSREALFKEEYKYFLSYTQHSPVGIPGITNYYLPLYAQKKDCNGTPIAILWFFDSQGGAEFQAPAGSQNIPNWVEPSIAGWFLAEQALLKKKWGKSLHLWHLSISHRLLSWLCKTIFFPMLEKNPYIFPD